MPLAADIFAALTDLALSPTEFRSAVDCALARYHRRRMRRLDREIVLERQRLLRAALGSRRPAELPLA